MPRSTPNKKSWPAILGGLVLVAAAGYFGIDLASTADSGPESGEDSNVGSDVGSDADSEGGAGAEADAVNAAGPEGDSGLPTCQLDTLPDQADIVVDTIHDGGPYDYPDNDNQRFGNYEGVLPAESSDYYREYTVETPGLDHRGARRIVTGGGTETDPEVWYYTSDHYESFCEIPDADSLYSNDTN